MVFLDANIPMYLVGADHPLKIQAAAILQRLALDQRPLVTDVEVFQEILHRYAAIRRPEAIQPAFDTLSALVEEVYPIDMATILEARSLVLGYTGLSARDALHVAAMGRHGVTDILSFDDGFDRVPGINRIGKL